MVTWLAVSLAIWSALGVLMLAAAVLIWDLPAPEGHLGAQTGTVLWLVLTWPLTVLVLSLWLAQQHSQTLATWRNQ